MVRVEKCAKCGSSTIAQRAMAVDRTDAGELDLQLRVDAKPSAMILKKSARSKLHAYVCSSCGYVEFYADNPKALYDAFLSAQQDSSGVT
jgi:predicted nucleic-acid-binding Zn-ribbon protein